MSKSKTTEKLEVSLQATLQDFYKNVIVPQAEADNADPVELFNATVKGALESKFQDDRDERRSSFFTLKN